MTGKSKLLGLLAIKKRKQVWQTEAWNTDCCYTTVLTALCCFSPTPSPKLIKRSLVLEYTWFLNSYQHLKFFSLSPIPVVPFPTVLAVLFLAFPVQVVPVFLDPASPSLVSPFLGALAVPFLAVLSPVAPVLDALFQVFPFLASPSPASPVPFVHDPASPVPAPSASVALATAYNHKKHKQTKNQTKLQSKNQKYWATVRGQEQMN